MDLGIAGRRALVCASSSGLGLACAAALAREGCEVWINGRRTDRLAQAQAQLAAAGAVVHAVAADLVTPAGRDALLAACPEPDILVNNNAGPPPGELADWDHAAWIAALEANLLAPLLLVRAVLPGMRARRFGRQLAGRTGLPVEYADERHTTQAAAASLSAAGVGGRRAKDVRDRVAAQLILQSWLDDHAR